MQQFSNTSRYETLTNLPPLIQIFHIPLYSLIYNYDILRIFKMIFKISKHSYQPRNATKESK